MKKEKAAALDVIIHKYKNKKMDLDCQQRQERSLNEHTNLLKASKKYFKIKFIFILKFFRNYC